ncbi:helix-turn-helix domain-containing protein [Daejeonella lutea]|nr:helix-turn-helix domain-containing protein [Daejeonella lutea]
MSEYEQKMLMLFKDFVNGQEKIISLLERLTPSDKDVRSEKVSKSCKDIHPGKGWIDRLDVADIFGNSESTIKRWTKDGILNGRRIGRKVWYRKSKLFDKAKKRIK